MYDYIIIQLLYLHLSKLKTIFALDYNHSEMDVKKVIKEKGHTIESVASSMGISAITLHQNLSRNPTIKTLQRIADVIGCKVGDFFKDEIDITLSDCNGTITIDGNQYDVILKKK